MFTSWCLDVSVKVCWTNEIIWLFYKYNLSLQEQVFHKAVIFKFLQGGGLNLLKNLNKLMGVLKENCISWHPRENHTHNFRDSWAPWSLVRTALGDARLTISVTHKSYNVWSSTQVTLACTQVHSCVTMWEPLRTQTFANMFICYIVHLLHQLVISMLLFFKSCFILLCNLLSGVEQEKAYQKGKEFAPLQ